MKDNELFSLAQECVIKGDFTAKGSHFLSYLMLSSAFNENLNMLKAQHPKAVHFVYATRYFNELGQICEKSSDDNEPHGSSGIPTLNVLRGEGLINCSIITVRYFGGTLLGVGGLVKAYTNAAKSAIKNAKEYIIPFIKQDKIHLECEYAHFNAILRQLKAHHLKLTHKTFLNDIVHLEIEGEAKNLSAFGKNALIKS